VPFVSPATVIGAAAGPATVPINPPGLDVAVYNKIGLPPFDEGAVKFTITWVLPAVPLTSVGALGTVNALGVTLLDATDAAPVPTAFVAVIVKV
jgi:hypothetical protein